jgi:pimeloyl-ACP methyl ester carboxylesterase
MSTLESRTITTPRLTHHLYVAGSPANPPVLLLHGNVSSAVFFDRAQAELADRYYVIAPDLRGYGKSESKPSDATRGVRDYADDLAELLASDELGVGRRQVHCVGWSAGGNVVLQLAIDHRAWVASLTLINPGSPYGYGGSKDLDGTPCFADFAGTGGGVANPQFVELLKAKDPSGDQQASPRNIMNGFYWKPPFRVDPATEDRYVAGMLDTVVGPGNYPGDATPSSNWPGVAPGTGGMNNALSPKYLNQTAIVELADKPPILWVRGADDQIVSDTSMFDLNYLGSLGFVPGWPGADVCPPQPMVGQTRAVLDRYAKAGGRYHELVLQDCGHGPHIEKHDEFMRTLAGFLAEVAG